MHASIEREREKERVSESIPHTFGEANRKIIKFDKKKE
jgi:hypothetical protein